MTVGAFGWPFAGSQQYQSRGSLSQERQGQQQGQAIGASPQANPAPAPVVAPAAVPLSSRPTAAGKRERVSGLTWMVDPAAAPRE